MDRLEEIIENRKAKVQKMVSLGLDPYPSSTNRTHTNQEALDGFSADDGGTVPLAGQVITLVGRVRGMRDMGKIIFAHIEDGTARIQVLFKDGETETFSLLQELLDTGDFLEATGTLFITKTGEKTLQATSYKILAKSIRPLPSEHFGLEDEEIKLRKRYLDILLDPEVKELFVKKSKFWTTTNDYLRKHGFMHVQTPILESVTGGAEAEPFVTHYNALDKDFYLRISPELWLKRLLVAGYEKVFETGRIFRNEGIDAEHLQDYTQMEMYWAYASIEDLMQFVQGLCQHVILETFGTLDLEYKGTVIHWGGEWPRQDYVDLFKKYVDIDILTVSDEELRTYATNNDIQFEPSAGRGRLMDLIWKKKIRTLPEVSMQPSFLINQPVEIEPLAKRVPGNLKLVQRMQILACGSELGKGFGELNDPIDQRGRFEEQARLRAAGDPEAQMNDTDYVEAMEYGMPPAAGFAYSDRLFSIFVDKPIRQTILFPPMRNSKE